MNDALKSPAANKQLEREIDRLAASIQRFRVDSQRFFAGDLKLPPDELRDKIATDIRRLRGKNLKAASASFRLGTLEAQFQSHQDLFGRRLRQREESDKRVATHVEKPAPDPMQGVILGAANDGPAVEALYRALQNPKMDLDRFRVYIERQADAIRDKTRCREIQFRIAVQDGKTKLKARPIRRKSSA